MAQSPSQPHEQRTRKPSTTRLLKGALAAGLTVRGIELDATGTLRVLVSGKDGQIEATTTPVPAKAPIEAANIEGSSRPIAAAINRSPTAVKG